MFNIQEDFQMIKIH